ncbi:MAG: hypothetical protein R3199_06250 [Gemmatimonadota bacterium]|nr:hypothetical protein [Gemmatimonadota bacterium]
MLRSSFPLVLALAPALVAGCGEDGREPEPEEATAEIETIPFADRALPVGGHALVSEAGDTIRFLVRRAEDRAYLELVQRRTGPAGADSVAALIDPDTKEPVASYHRRFTEEGDTLVARVAYGTGFEGQARLSITAPGADVDDNLRTPDPVLDAAQIPQTLSALRFGRPDTIPFNYVAPFEREALAGRLLVGRPDTLRIDGASISAWRVDLQAGGLEERYWFSTAPDPYRLIRFREITRDRTWTRVGAADAAEEGPS